MSGATWREFLERLDGRTPCDGCGRRARAMVTATFPDGAVFDLCASCGEDARDHGCEVTS